METPAKICHELVQIATKKDKKFVKIRGERYQLRNSYRCHPPRTTHQTIFITDGVSKVREHSSGTLPASVLMHKIHQSRHMLNRGGGQDAVTQIKNMARFTLNGIQNTGSLALDFGNWGQ